MTMQKKLTITLDEHVYNGLHANIGRGKISKFIENLVRPYTEWSLEQGYKALSEDQEAELEAKEWCEELIGDVDYEA